MMEMELIVVMLKFIIYYDSWDQMGDDIDGEAAMINQDIQYH